MTVGEWEEKISRQHQEAGSETVGTVVGPVTAKRISRVWINEFRATGSSCTVLHSKMILNLCFFPVSFVFLTGALSLSSQVLAASKVWVIHLKCLDFSDLSVLQLFSDWGEDWWSAEINMAIFYFLSLFPSTFPAENQLWRMASTNVISNTGEAAEQPG